MDNNYQNIVAKFGKSLQMNISDLGKHYDEEHPVDSWIVLGYFDMLQTIVLPNENGNWLNAIWDYNVKLTKSIDGKAYLHPLHMMVEIKNNGSKYKKFWRYGAPYMLLTLVQTNSTMDPPDNLWGPVKRVAYRTMELSDYVLVWKSNSLVKLLEELKKFHDDNNILDTNTFVAINYNFLKSPGRSIDTYDASHSLFVSSRYVVQDAQAERLYFESTNKALKMSTENQIKYLTIGMEDIAVLYKDIPVETFLKMLHNTLFDERIHEVFGKAFSECVTQIGLDDDIEDIEYKQDDSKINLQLRCQTLQEILRSLENDPSSGSTSEPIESARNISWLKPTANLCNALSDMSRSYVLDEFCYLVLDAAETFLKHVKELFASGRCPNNTELSRFQRFVRGWDMLMEQATRTDGRFIQTPSFSPVLCEIPTRLLEFYLAFSSLYAETLSQTRDADDERISLLIVPKICRRVKLQAIFGGNGCQLPQGVKHLLYVDVPLNQLYDSRLVLCCLCHEVSHYSGGEFRSRKDRRGKLVLVAAVELAAQLKIPYDNAIRYLYEWINHLVLAVELPSDYYLPLIHCIKGATKMVLLDDNLIFEILSNIDTSSQNLENMAEFQNNLIVSRSSLIANYAKFEKHLENIGYLFNECYADVSMVYLLRPTKVMYLELARPELAELQIDFQWDGKEILEDPRYYFLVQRWSAVLNIEGLWDEGDSINFDNEKNDDVLLAAFYRDINSIANNNIWERIDTQRPKNTNTSYNLLCRYLSTCFQKLEQELSSNTDFRLLREAFKQMAEENSIEWTRYNDNPIIQRFRQKLSNLDNL